MAAVKEHLVSAAGALLLAPAYDRPGPRDRLHHPLRRRAARERRRLHARGDLGDRGGGEGRRTPSSSDASSPPSTRRARTRSATGPSPTSCPATSTAPTRRSTAAPAGPGTPARRSGCTASSASGSSASGPNGTACASTRACRRRGNGARMTRPWRGATLDVTVVRDGIARPRHGARRGGRTRARRDAPPAARPRGRARR